MTFPENIKYAKSHEWVRVDGEVATIGITDFAQSELGDVVYVEIEGVGQAMEQGSSFGTIEAVKAVSDLYMPISGEIVEANPVLTTAPETINKDPYGEGWMIKVMIQGGAAQNSGLMDAAEYRAMIGQ